MSVNPPIPGSDEFDTSRLMEAASAHVSDGARREQLLSAVPAVQELFHDYARDNYIPALNWGLVVNSELAFSSAYGVHNLEQKLPASDSTVFRIASMSKSFIVMAILRLRDYDALRLDDAVVQYVPELESLKYPTLDAPPLTLRHLLTMTPGFPEDNPWGDRQMAIDDATFARWLRAGIPFSNVPGIHFEYSNYAYAILGRVVTRVSGVPFQEYTARHIFEPLGMERTTWDMAQVPAARRAIGYRWQDESHIHEPMLADGAFAGMAGVFTTIPDFARYMTFLLDAFPPRDDPERGPIRRATAREMQQMARFEDLQEWEAAGAPKGRAAVGYGFGLAVAYDERIGYSVGHGGGLPGFGSYFLMMPHCRAGIVAFSNQTYARLRGVVRQALAILWQSGGLTPRAIQPAPVLLEMRDIVARWLNGGDEQELAAHAADNFYLDRDRAHRRVERERVCQEIGGFLRADEFKPQNALRGTWRVHGARGYVDIALTLAPTMPPRIQFVWLTPSAPLNPDAI